MGKGWSRGARYRYLDGVEEHGGEVGVREGRLRGARARGQREHAREGHEVVVGEALADELVDVGALGVALEHGPLLLRGHAREELFAIGWWVVERRC